MDQYVRLALGARGSNVEHLQLRLTAVGFKTPVTGVFTDKTQQAVILFQRQQGYELSGVVGREVHQRLIQLCPSICTKKPTRSSAPPVIPVTKQDQTIDKGQVQPENSELTLIQEPIQEPKPIPAVTVKRLVFKNPGILVLVVDLDDQLDAIVKELSQFMPSPWGMVAIVKQELTTKPSGTMQFFSAVKGDTGDFYTHWQQALKACCYFSANYPYTMPCTGPGSTLSRVNGLTALLASGKSPVAIGPWQVGDCVIEPSKTAILDAVLPLDACLFRTCRLADVKLKPELGPACFSEAIYSWQLAGEPIDVDKSLLPVFVGKPVSRSSTWPKHREAMLAKQFSRPKISALMLTGRCLERYPLAMVAVRCFFNQTWPNKELVIVNHGPISISSLLPIEQRVHVRELRLIRQESISLGELRNLSMDLAEGELLIQWDDDDWHHPIRMEVQARDFVAGSVNTLGWQVRCNLDTGAAFYDFMPGGQHMSVLFEKTAKRYEAINAREDTQFFALFDKQIVIDNNPDNVLVDPMLYVRFYHGMNIWDSRHIMGGSQQDRNDRSIDVELSSYHASRMKQICQDYAAVRAGFSEKLGLLAYRELPIS